MASSEFAILTEALDLAEAGHLNAARTRWDSMSRDFQMRTMKLVHLLCLSGAQEEKLTERITIASPFGEFVFTQATFDQMRRHIPNILATNV